MELCTSRAIYNLPKPGGLFTTSHGRFPLIKKASNFGLNSGGLHYGTSGNSYVRLAKSEETSSFTSQYTKDETDSVVTTGNPQSREQINAYETVQNKATEPEENNYNSSSNEETDDSPLSEFQAQLSEFLDQLNVEFSPENLPPVLVYGGGAAIVLWLTNAVVGAIDSIPLFPKLMEVVGLGYTVWFTSRYLLLKKNRDELASKVEEIKKQVLGSDRE